MDEVHDDTPHFRRAFPVFDNDGRRRIRPHEIVPPVIFAGLQTTPAIPPGRPIPPFSVPIVSLLSSAVFLAREGQSK